MVAKRKIKDARMAGTLKLQAVPKPFDLEATLNKISDMFGNIGLHPATVIPAGVTVKAKRAADYAVADKLLRMAENRRNEAIVAGQRVGLFQDLHSYDVGVHTAFDCPQFKIIVTEGEEGQMIDPAALRTALAIALGPQRAEALLKQCSKPRDGNTCITVQYKF